MNTSDQEVTQPLLQVLQHLHPVLQLLPPPFQHSYQKLGQVSQDTSRGLRVELPLDYTLEWYSRGRSVRCQMGGRYDIQRWQWPGGNCWGSCGRDSQHSCIWHFYCYIQSHHHQEERAHRLKSQTSAVTGTSR